LRDAVERESAQWGSGTRAACPLPSELKLLLVIVSYLTVKNTKVDSRSMMGGKSNAPVMINEGVDNVKWHAHDGVDL